MKWLIVTNFLFVIAYVSATNSTTVAPNAALNSTDSPKDSQQTYPYRISRAYDTNSNDNNYKNGPYTGRFFDIPNPAPGSNLFNTSLAFTIPLFSINTKALTGRSLIEPLDGLKYGAAFPPLGSGVVAGLAIPALVAGILILLFDVFSRPFLMNNQGRASDSIFSGGFGGIAEYILTFAENSLDHLPSIDGEECIKRSVCEAHSNPKKYGIIALPLQLLFP